MAEATARARRQLGRMTRALRLMGTAYLLIVVQGCGSESHPAPIGSNGGSAGSSGGSAGTAGSGMGGTTNAGSSSGGAAGTAGAAGSGEITPLKTFDPDRVYVQGRHQSGDCRSWVIALPEAPSDYYGSFPCDNEQPALRGDDGALAYRVGPGDFRIWETDFVTSGFPPNPETNDIPLSSPTGCSVTQQWFQPGSHDRLVLCEDGRTLSPTGELDLGGDSLLAVGKDGVLLTASDTAFSLRSAGTTTPVELGSLTLSPTEVGHARSFGDGFLLLRAPTGETPDPALRITPDGSVVQLADYPAAPGSTILQLCQLEPDGAAVCIGLSDSQPAVLRFDTQAGSQVVFSEGGDLFLDSARLLTGP